MATSTQTITRSRTKNVVQPIVTHKAAYKTCPKCHTENHNRRNVCIKEGCGYDFIHKAFLKQPTRQVQRPQRVAAARIEKQPGARGDILKSMLTLDIAEINKLQDRMIKFPRDYYDVALAAVDAEGIVAKIKTELTTLETNTDAAFRQAESEAGRKTTEKQVENYLNTHPFILKKREELLMASLEMKRRKCFVDSSEFVGKILLRLADGK